MFYCARCGARFSAAAATSALVCPSCHVEDAVFAPFTSWAFDLAERSESEGAHVPSRERAAVLRLTRRARVPRNGERALRDNPPVAILNLEQRDIGGGHCEIVVRGELDLAVAERLEEAIDAAAKEHAGIVIGLAQCEFIDSSGIAVILRAHQRLGDQERHLVVCCPEDQVERVLDITGLSENGLVYDSLDGAIAAIEAAGAEPDAPR